MKQAEAGQTPKRNARLQDIGVAPPKALEQSGLAARVQAEMNELLKKKK